MRARWTRWARSGRVRAASVRSAQLVFPLRKVGALGGFLGVLWSQEGGRAACAVINAAIDVQMRGQCAPLILSDAPRGKGTLDRLCALLLSLCASVSLSPRVLLLLFFFSPQEVTYTQVSSRLSFLIALSTCVRAVTVTKISHICAFNFGIVGLRIIRLFGKYKSFRTS